MKATYRRVGVLALALALSPALSPSPGQAQSGRSEYQSLLAAREKQVELHLASRELERAEKLLAEGLMSEAEVGKARATLEKAQLGFQDALLGLVSLQSRLAVREAIKYQGPTGEQFVRLIIVNHTMGLDDSAAELLESIDQDARIRKQLVNRSIRNVSISIRDTGAPASGNVEPIRGATIALPYEQFIPEIEYLGERTLDFRLLKDVSTILVHVDTGSGIQETALHLQQAKGEQSLRIVCSQSSLEADLGAAATYQLRFVRASTDTASFRVKVLNLPRQIGASFLDAQTGARLNQVTFPAGVTEQPIALRVFLPKSVGGEVQPDAPLRFWVVAASDDQIERLAGGQSHAEEELRASRAGYVGLELIPRGVGAIELSTVSLFSELPVGETLSMALKVNNRGSRRVDNVRIVAEPPLGWRAVAEPALIPSLEPRQSHEVALHITPSLEAAVGEYEVRLRAESTAFDQQVPSQEKTYRIALKSRTGVLTTGIVLVLVLAGISGLVVAGIRLARR